jgi:hypothetical protein
VLGIVCGGLGRWYVASLPPPPSATAVGESVEFDSQVAEVDRRFAFVVAENTRIVLSGIDGKVEQVLFDLAKYASAADAEIFGDVKLSPNRRRLLVPCLYGDWEPAANRKLLIVELSPSNVVDVPMPTGKFEFDMGAGNDSLCCWNDDSSIIVSLTYYPPGAAHQFEKKFMLYNLASLDSPSILDLGVKRPSGFQFPDEFTAMYLADDEPVDQWKVRVLAKGKTRLATTREADDYRKLVLSGNTRGQLPITVTQVDHRESDIHLDGRWVRRSEGVIERHPLWDEELGLLVWEEYGPSSFKTFFCDANGHYRPMYPGRFVGKISRTELQP